MQTKRNRRSQYKTEKNYIKEIAQNNVDDIKRLRNDMYKSRAKVLLPNPTNVLIWSSLVYCHIKITAVRNEYFVLDNDENKNVIIFSCEKNLHFLSHVENLYVDDMFKYSAIFFEQMFTIRAYKNGHYNIIYLYTISFLPISYKSVQIYEFVFKKITEHLITLDYVYHR